MLPDYFTYRLRCFSQNEKTRLLLASETGLPEFSIVDVRQPSATSFDWRHQQFPRTRMGVLSLFMTSVSMRDAASSTLGSAGLSRALYRSYRTGNKSEKATHITIVSGMPTRRKSVNL